MSPGTNETRLGFVSLFVSLGTLVCCALPSLLVVLGLGATMASLLSAVPWLATISRHKEWVFLGSGALIAGNAFYVYRLAPRLRARAQACSPAAPDACEAAGRLSRIALWISAGLWSVGFFTAFVLGPVLTRFSE